MLKTLDMRFRWMIPRDYSEVAAIDQQHIWLKWMPEDFKKYYKHRNAISTVVEVNELIVGYCCYRMMDAWIEIDRIAVDRRFHRQGIGRGLLINLMNKLSIQRRSEIVAWVPERNLAAQLLFSSAGFVGRLSASGNEICFAFSIKGLIES